MGGPHVSKDFNTRFRIRSFQNQLEGVWNNVHYYMCQHTCQVAACPLCVCPSLSLGWLQRWLIGVMYHFPRRRGAHSRQDADLV